MHEFVLPLLKEVEPYDAEVVPPSQRPDPRFGRFLEDGTPRLSPSQVNQLHTCPGKWVKEYLEGVPGKPGWQADVGSIAHGGMELFIRGEDHKQVLGSTYDAAMIHLTRVPDDYFQNPLERTPEDHAHRIEGALERLMIWWESEELKFIAAEEPWEQRFTVDGTQVAMHGRYDALVEDQNGRRLVVDWKFPGRTWNGPSREGYQYATCTYRDALIQQGERIDGFGIIHAGQDGAEIHADWYIERDDLIPWARERTTAAMQRVLNQDLPFDSTTPGPLCSAKWCHLYGKCPATSRW